MFDHIGLHVTDLDAGVRFYSAVLAPLGHVLCARDDVSAGFGPSKDAPAFWLYRAKTSAPAHVAFRAADHKAVQRFHAAGLDAGGADNGKPGPREDYGPTYYAAFLTDPDGHNVEAVVP